MNGFSYYLMMFAAAALLLQSVSALDRVSTKTHHGIRFAFLGLALSAFYVLADTAYSHLIPAGALVCVLIATSVLLAVDRRGRND